MHRGREAGGAPVSMQQIQAQQHIIAPVLEGKIKARAPWPLLILQWLPILRRIPGRFIGLGVQPEHIETSEFKMRG